MKKLVIVLTAAMFMLSSLVYAGGDQNCGDNGVGDTGENAPGEATQNRAPNP